VILISQFEIHLTCKDTSYEGKADIGATTPVVFGGVFRRFRWALSQMLGLYSVYPEILQAVFPGLFSTELNLSVAELVKPNAIC